MKPIIAEAPYQFAKDPKFNTINIYIDARPESDLSWDSLEVEIQTALKLKAKLSFEIDLGLTEDRPLFKDTKSYQTRALAIASFEERVYVPYKENITSIIMYRGKADFKVAIFQDAALEDDFNIWKSDFFPDKEVSEHILRLFSMEIFMRYLHRVAAPLLDEIPVIALIDFSDIKERAYQAELLSMNFFPYIVPGIRGSLINFLGFGWDQQGRKGSIGRLSYEPLNDLEPNIGVVLPETGLSSYEDLNEVLSIFEDLKLSYKIIPESLLTDMWFGIDHLVVFSSAISSEGIRMLHGFIAASGEVVVFGDSLNLVDEISFTDFVVNSNR
jgi:hypothetical protein